MCKSLIVGGGGEEKQQENPKHAQKTVANGKSVLLHPVPFRGLHEVYLNNRTEKCMEIGQNKIEFRWFWWWLKPAAGCTPTKGGSFVQVFIEGG